MAARRNEAEALPALVRWVAIPIAGALLFLFFLHLGFPYDRLAERVAAWLSHSTQSRIEIAGLAPRLSIGGPGLEARGVTAVIRTGEKLEFERAFLRPAWSLAWLRANPAVLVDVDGVAGAARGVTTLRIPGFHGALRGIEVARLPLANALPGTSLRGQADLDLDLELGEAGPEGTGRFEMGAGVLGLPGLPIPLPFTRFSGELRFGGDNLAELTDATLEGDVVSAHAHGTLGHAARVESAPLALVLELTAAPGLRAPLQAAGIQLGPDGKGTLQVTGTPARPQVR